MARLFGTDGVRGVANTAELSPELAFALGEAATWLAKNGRLGGAAPGVAGAGAGPQAAQVGRAGGSRRPLAVVGRDTRQSGPLLESALVAGILAAGGDVARLGVVTTPAVAHLVRELGADFGVVISASHNPPEYNGIKFFSAEGYKLPDPVEDELADLALAGRQPGPRPTGAGVGTLREDPDLVERYVDHVARSGVRLDGLHVVVDCGHGAAFRLAPAVLRRLGAQVTVLNDAPDGMNINLGCGSTHPQGLQQAVVALGAHAGIAHDGDADRCIAVDGQGRVVDGDQILAICALDLDARGLLPDKAVVATVMSNMGLEVLLRRHGIRLLRTPVGDRYVLEEMLRTGARLGGEQSGHIIFRDHATTGDGILTAVQLLSVVVRSGRSLAELAAQMDRYPQLLENVRVQRKEGWDQNPRIAAAIRAAEAALDGQGRVLVRPSGTEPLIRIMLEGPDATVLRQLAGELREVIAQELA